MLPEMADISAAIGSSATGILNWVNTLCWAACFLWMWRISEKQNALLSKLQEQNCRIEKLSKAEHDLIKEVHPKVGEIQEHLEEVSETIKENDVKEHGRRR